MTEQTQLSLNEAIKANNLNRVQELILDGSDENKALNKACEEGQLEVVELLLKYGADVHTNNDEALRIACEEGELKVVEVLLEYGADVHACNDEPLRKVCQNEYFEYFNRYIEVVKLLLEHDADVHACNDESLRIACCEGHLEAVDALLEYGADVHACNDEPLRKACQYGDFEIVKLLIEHGADIHACNDEPIRVARNNGCTEIVQYIESLIKEEPQFSKKPDDSGFKKTEGAVCPITQEVLTKEMRKLGCSKCKNVFDYNGLTKWLDSDEGNKCPFRCDGSVFYEV